MRVTAHRGKQPIPIAEVFEVPTAIPRQATGTLASD
jgi:hypothetical protein